MIRQLGHAILGNSGNLDTRTVVLVSLALHSGLLITVFGLKETRSCKTRIDEITNGDAAGDAVEEAIEAKQSAIFVATVISALASI